MVPLYAHFCTICGRGIHLDYIPDEWDDDDPECIDLWGTLMWMCSRRTCSNGQTWKVVERYMTENGITYIF